MTFIAGQDRNESILTSLNREIAEDSPARLVDLFVSLLDMKKMGFLREKDTERGRPGYDPRMMLAIYIYGNMEGIRSSRKLQKACEVNREFSWLMHGLRPDFRSIARFRRDHASSFKQVFNEFNGLLRNNRPNPDFYSVDGSKFLASDSRDNNISLPRLESLTEFIRSRMKKRKFEFTESEAYLDAMDRNDAIEVSKEAIETSKESEYTAESLDALIRLARDLGLDAMREEAEQLKSLYKK